MKIEALHEFHDPEFAQAWADKFVPTPDRIDLFSIITNELNSHGAIKILELGIGPGFLAEYILGKMPEISYEGLDISKPMLDIAKNRNYMSEGRISFTEADLVNEDWTVKVKSRPDAIVTTWALHDLFTERNIAEVYQSVYNLLPENGLFLNGDFVKPEESRVEYEGGRIKPSIHIELLEKIGFQWIKMIKEFEKDVENPTTANNYSCFKAVK